MKVSSIISFWFLMSFVHVTVVGGAGIPTSVLVSKYPLYDGIIMPEGQEEQIGISDTNHLPAEEQPPLTRNRRQLFPAELNPKIGAIIRSLDENDCIGRFFCELGCDTKIFGPLGELINTAMMFVNHQETMAARPYKIGQEKGLQGCTMKCDSNMLHKIIRYANRQLFTKPEKTKKPPKHL